MSQLQKRGRFVATKIHWTPAKVLLTLAALIVSLGAGQAAFGQVVAVITPSFSVGDNLFNNLLDGSYGPGGNTLDDITVGNGNTVPDGTTIQPWNQSLGQYMPASTFSAASQTWSVDYTLLPGEGAKLNTTSAFSNTFIGAVQSAEYDSSGQVIQGGLDPTTYAFVNPPPMNTPGVYLLGCVAPISPATFQMIVGRDPLVGETVRSLDSTTQTYSSTTFEGGGTWNNGAPALDGGSGEAAFFTLMPLGGDAIGNGTVDINDLTIVLSNFGNSVGMDWSTGDFNGDGRVDVNDLTILLTNFGKSIGSPAGLRAVPEPSAIGLLGLGIAGLLAVAWRRKGR
jgi:hypothetical protein